MMTNQLTVINEQVVLGKEFRIYGDADSPLFLAKDVAHWIDYSISNVSKMLNTVDEDEKTTRKISTNGSYTTDAWFLTEDGLYEVLMQSRKPIAKAFKKEVKNILKAIRQDGGFIATNEDDDDATIMAKALLVAQKTISKKSKQLEDAKKVIEEQQPFVVYSKQIVESDTSIDMSKMANFVTKRGFVIGRNTLFGKLREWGLLKKDNTPYQQYMNQGYFEVTPVITHNKMQVPKTYVTAKGQLYIVNRLVKEKEEMNKTLKEWGLA